MRMTVDEIIELVASGSPLCIPEQAMAAECLREYKYYSDLKRDNRLYELPCKAGETIYAVDIIRQREERRRIERAEAVKYKVDHFEIGEAETLYAIVCNDKNEWTSLKADEIYDKKTAEDVARVINEIRRNEDAAH